MKDDFLTKPSNSHTYWLSVNAVKVNVNRIEKVICQNVCSLSSSVISHISLLSYTYFFYTYHSVFSFYIIIFIMHD